MLARTLISATGLLLLSVLAAPAYADDPIANYEAMPVAPAGRQALSLQQVRDAIIAAGTPLQWKFSDAGPGKLVGALTVRSQHMIEVEIAYNPQNYSVVYRSSVNMRYNAADKTIHRNYNVWVKQLVDRINLALAVLPTGPAVASAPGAIEPPPVPPSAAPGAAASSGSPFPQVGDSWTYRLSEPKRRDGPTQRTYVVTVGAASTSEIVDQLSVGGEPAITSRHTKGNYLVAQGASVFSPYLPVFDGVSLSGALKRIEVLDLKSAYIWEAKGKIAGRETVSVPAGQFIATKIVIEQWWRSAYGLSFARPGGRVLTVWYAPEAKRAVKYSSRPTFGGDVAPIETHFDLELVSYQLK